MNSNQESIEITSWSVIVTCTSIGNFDTVVHPPSNAVLHGLPRTRREPLPTGTVVSGKRRSSTPGRAEVVSGKSPPPPPRPGGCRLCHQAVKNGRGCCDIFPLSSGTHTAHRQRRLASHSSARRGGSTIKGPSSVKDIFHLHHMGCEKQEAHFWRLHKITSILYITFKK